MTALRVLTADNPGPFTLDGTRTHLVGELRVAIIDPGPDAPEHVRAVARAVEGARSVVILQTHDHDDHAGGAPDLAARTGAEVLGAGAGATPMADGDGVETDRGRLVAVSTPGHARRHLSFHWPGESAVFVGDLLLGRGETTWVGAYAGCVQDYLDSLDRIEALEPRILYPAHGAPIRDPAAAVERYRAHRRERLEQVRRARERRPAADPAELVRLVYGPELPEGALEAARLSVETMLHHLESS